MPYTNVCGIAITASSIHNKYHFSVNDTTQGNSDSPLGMVNISKVKGQEQVSRLSMENSLLESTGDIPLGHVRVFGMCLIEQVIGGA